MGVVLCELVARKPSAGCRYDLCVFGWRRESGDEDQREFGGGRQVREGSRRKRGRDCRKGRRLHGTGGGRLRCHPQRFAGCGDRAHGVLPGCPVAPDRDASTSQTERDEMGTDNRGGRRAVFLDRDGVINRNVWNPATLEYESPLTADAFELLPGVLSALAELRRAGYLIFLVSNQPNYAKQKVSMEILDAIHQKLIAATARAGIAWAACYYCFHHPEGFIQGYSGACVCRKPSPYFLFWARRDFGLELSLSWMIGDRESDVQCGRAAGTRTILIADGEAGGVVVTADHRAVDLAQAVRLISGC